MNRRLPSIVMAAIIAETSCRAVLAAPWSFVVIGDTRADSRASPTGISAALPALAGAIVGEHPELVIHCGDLTNGYWLPGPLAKQAGKATYLRMFEHFLAAMAPIYQAGIPVYIVRGNHEFGGEVAPGTGVANLIAAYREVFAAKMPRDGPADAKGLTYSFTHRSVSFLVTDQYVGSRGEDVHVDNAWLGQALAQDHRPIVFTFGHAPAFGVINSLEEKEFQLANNRGERDRFWQLNEDHQVAAYFTSHEHFYTRGKVGNVWQIVQGNGGASPRAFAPGTVDSALRQVFPDHPVSKADFHPGYLVVTIDDDQQTVKAVEKVIDDAGNVTVFDRFNIR